MAGHPFTSGLPPPFLTVDRASCLAVERSERLWLWMCAALCSRRHALCWLPSKNELCVTALVEVTLHLKASLDLWGINGNCRSMADCLTREVVQPDFARVACQGWVIVGTVESGLAQNLLAGLRTSPLGLG